MKGALRVIERCSNIQDTDNHLINLKTKLRKRNYPEKLINSKFRKAKKMTRNSLINQNRHEKNDGDNKVRLIFTYNRGNPPLHAWLRGAKKCLVKDEKAKELGKQFQICYKQPRNLKSRVTHIRKPCPSEENPGCTKCGRCRVSCPVLVEGTKFTSTNTQRTYNIRKKLTCDRSFVIYLATCKRCRGQYVGKSTTPFKKRHLNHTGDQKEVWGVGASLWWRGGL